MLKLLSKIPESLVKRIKGLAWAVAMMAAAGLLDALQATLSDWNMPTLVTVSLGLVLAQISKYLNTQVKQ